MCRENYYHLTPLPPTGFPDIILSGTQRDRYLKIEWK
jgi:hypothetical protein